MNGEATIAERRRLGYFVRIMRYQRMAVVMCTIALEGSVKIHVALMASEVWIPSQKSWLLWYRTNALY